MKKAPLPVHFHPCLSLKPRRIVHYSQPTRTLERRKNPFKTGKEAYDAITILSYKARQRIHTYTQYLVDTAKKKRVYSKSENKWFSFYVNFVTLTLPSQQVHTDGEIHATIFKAFIRAWKTKEPGLMYIYKAEVQDNGNLHYHLTTNAYIHHTELRNMWNYYCNKLGYTDRCKVENPNSTDVHSVKNVKKLAEYIGKYMAKTDYYTKTMQRYHRIYDKKWRKINYDKCTLPKNYFEYIKRHVTIKIWDCSKLLKAVEPIKIENPDWYLESECRNIHQIFGTTKKFDYCYIQQIEKDWLKKWCPLLYEKYMASLSDLIKANKLIKAEHMVI